MSIARVQLEAVRSGPSSAPAENVTVKVTNGPWTKSSHMFKRNLGESAEAWCDRVLKLKKLGPSPKQPPRHVRHKPPLI